VSNPKVSDDEEVHTYALSHHGWMRSFVARTKAIWIASRLGTYVGAGGNWVALCEWNGSVMKRSANVLALAMCTFATGSAFGQTLKTVIERGYLICGVSEGVYGFSAADGKGNWSGFDVDLCRAIAAAIFNDASKVRFTPLSATDRFTSLQSGEVDVLSRNSTWTMSRETELKLNFVAITYYDGQGFLVRNARNVASALELDDPKICVQRGTTTELNLGDYFRANKMAYEPITHSNPDDARKAYDSGRCNVLTSDVSQLYAARLKLATPDRHVVLPDIISKEPLGPVVRQGDDQWFNIVKWTHFAMINAEELGVKSTTIEEALKSERPDVKRFVGTEGSYGESLGLSRGWALHIIKLVGNYGQVFERNVGVGSKLGIPRGINQLWTSGGIQYAPPIR
jgi:general L-amino acid transport system substrate-binding protein